MSDQFSEDEVMVLVTRLSRTRLVAFIEGAFVKPQRSAKGYVFRQIDIARLELLCDLSLDLGFDETALGVVISLIDQLHAARQDLALMAKAVDQLPADVRAEVLAGLAQS